VPSLILEQIPDRRASILEARLFLPMTNCWSGNSVGRAMRLALGAFNRSSAAIPPISEEILAGGRQDTLLDISRTKPII
jgi:hypothetical protein